MIFGKAADFSPILALSNLDGRNGFKLSGIADFDRAGSAVSAAGDVNGDGFDDVIIGAGDADEGGTDRGAAYVVLGKAGDFAASMVLSALDGTNGFKLSGSEDNATAGDSVSGAGDVNGDGFDDLIVGATRAAEGGVRRGAAYVVFGDEGGFFPNVALSSLNGTDGFKLSGTADEDRVGGSVSAAGDVNGDGLDDLVIGAYGADEGGVGRGAAYVVFGKTGISAAVIPLGALNGGDGFKLSGIADADDTGRSVSGAGDVNGDGFADVLIGARDAHDGGDRRGAGYVVFGKAAGFFPSMVLSALNGANGFKLSTAEDRSQVGGAASAAGDLNGDGFADLIIGASDANGGGTNRGAAYVVFGGPSGEFIDPVFSNGGKTATWTDVDGDRVTLKVSAGTLDPGNFKLLAKSTADSRAQLLSLSLGGEFEGADLSITAKRAAGGDGKVNVGAINALFTDLGKVTIGGDLGQIDVGDGDAVAPFKSLTVGSFGVFGTRTQDTGGDLTSQIFGPAGPINIAGDLREVFIAVGSLNMDSPATLASVTIGGSLIGGKGVGSGAIAATDLGPVKIGGDMIGGAGHQSGYLQATNLASLTIGGDVRGGGGIFSGTANIGGNIGNVTIGGSQIGDSGIGSGSLLGTGSLGKVKIKRDQIGGDGTASALIFTSAAGSNIASVTIGGDARGGDAAFSGGILAGGTLGPVSIKGDVIGTAERAFTIRGSGPLTGTKSVAITSLKVGGDFEHALILAGYGADNVPVNGHAQIGAITVGGDWIASSAAAGLLTHTGAANANGVFGNDDEVFIPLPASSALTGVAASIASVTIKGRAIGTVEPDDFFGIVAEQIGKVTVGGVKLAFDSGPGNDAGYFVGPTQDFAIYEFGRG